MNDRSNSEVRIAFDRVHDVDTAGPVLLKSPLYPPHILAKRTVREHEQRRTELRNQIRCRAPFDQKVTGRTDGQAIRGRTDTLKYGFGCLGCEIHQANLRESGVCNTV